MIRAALVYLCLLICHLSYSQLYFQDIVTANNSGKNFQLLKTNKVKKVAVTSIEPDGNETEGFGISQTINSSSNLLTTVTNSGMTGTTFLNTYFDKNNLPVKIVDSSTNTVTTVSYHYDNNGKLQAVNSNSHEPDDTNHYAFKEDHFFTYNPGGQLTGMLKVRNSTDTLKVVFVTAENGLPGEEQWFKNNRKTETWYYYYDDKNRLTDIVRYNATAKKMLPDYVYDYDDNGNLEQQTVVQPGTNFYRLWVYEYDEKGLKKAETVFNKGKQQEGRIIYQYE